MNSFPEPLVARVTGLNRTVLAKARRGTLTKDQEWLLVGSVVHYTPGGLKKMLAAVGIDVAALVWPEPSGTDLETERALDPAASPIDPAELREGQDEAAVVTAACETAAAIELVEIFVSSVPRNPRILYGIPAGGTAAVVVRVKDNTNFRPAMKLKAHPPAAGATVWHMVGHCPRWPGRY